MEKERKKGKGKRKKGKREKEKGKGETVEEKDRSRNGYPFYPFYPSPSHSIHPAIHLIDQSITWAPPQGLFGDMKQSKEANQMSKQ